MVTPVRVIERPRMEVHNVVGTADLGVRLPLSRLSQGLGRALYDPEYYHALIYRCKSSPTSVLVNTSGKVVVVGGKSKDDLEIGLKEVATELRQLGFRPRCGPIRVVNMVASGKFPFELALPAISELAEDLFHLQTASHESKLVLRILGETRATVILFRNGSLLVSGASCRSMITEAADLITELVAMTTTSSEGRLGTNFSSSSGQA